MPGQRRKWAEPTEKADPAPVDPAPAEDVQLARLGADLIAVGEAYLTRARKWAATGAPAEFTAAVRDLEQALSARDDGATIVAALARLVYHGQPRRLTFGAQLHGLYLGVQAWFRQNRRNIGGHNARLHREAAAFWAPWQEQYRALRATGWGEAAAREQIGGLVAAAGGPVDDKTLRKWLSG